MIQKYWSIIKDSVKNDINVILLCLYLFLPVFFIPVSVLSGETAYKIVFMGFTACFVIISCIKNKKIVSWKDFLVGSIVLFLFIIDFFLRKNSYTISIYLVAVRTILVPFYLFNRIEKEKRVNILKYLSIFSKIAMIIFLFDPLFHYYFTGTYMGYGYSVMLPAFLSIYLYHFIKPKDNDWLFLLLAGIGIVIFANRNCILAIFFAFLFSFKYFKYRVSNIKEILKQIKSNIKQFAISNLVVLLLLAFSFACNYGIAKIDYASKHPTPPKEQEVTPTPTPVVTPTPTPEPTPEPTGEPTVTPTPTLEPTLTPTPEPTLEPTPTPEDDFDFNWRSYSFDKYSQVLNGKTDRILSGRIRVYKKVFKVMNSDVLSNPLAITFGMGTGYFMSVYKGIYTHCIFFDLFMEYGVIGTIIFLTLLGYCIYKFVKLKKKDKVLYLVAVYFFTIAFPKLLLSSYFPKEESLFLFIFLILSVYPIDFKEIFKRKNKQ